MTDPQALKHRSRYELLQEARALGVERPERMTREELRDEIIRLSVPEDEQQGARGLFGVARAMLASVVEAGLKLPDAARVIRGDATLELPLRSRSPVATVTLAEIYAAQGHKGRALAMLDEVLALEPDHDEALRIRAELVSGEVRRPVDPVENSGADLARDYVPVSVVEASGQEAPATPPPAPAAAAFISETGEPAPLADASPPAEPGVPAEPSPPAEPSDPFLVYRHAGHEVHLYWELPREALLRAGIDLGEGAAAVRVVAFTPAGTSPTRREHTAEPEWGPPFSGRLVLEGFDDSAVVRAAVGWMTEGTFLPLSVGAVAGPDLGGPAGERARAALGFG